MLLDTCVWGVNQLLVTKLVDTADFMHHDTAGFMHHDTAGFMHHDSWMFPDACLFFDAQQEHIIAFAAVGTE